MVKDEKRQRLLDDGTEEPQTMMFGLKKPSGKDLQLLMMLLLVVVAGTANRVTFKIMQYGNINYMYFVSQFTTLVYIPVNLAVVLFKIFVTKTITPEMRRFPQKSLFVMGLLDSLQGLLIVVGGKDVPGMMQNLLLQGAVPVTMFFSVLLLRPRGCKRCRSLRKVLRQHGDRLQWETRTTLPAADCTDGCVARVYDGPVEIKVAEILTIDPSAGGTRTALSDTMEQGNTLIVFTSGQSWHDHIHNFYHKYQYFGAAVVLAGLIISVWPAVTGGGGAGPPLWDVVFFLATVPTALSGVYKEIGFRKIELDVWYLNLWVAIYQTICTFFYFPLAAKMSDIPISDVPRDISRGFICYATGHNYITDDCSPESDCGGDNKQCCDSCDGSIHDVSPLSAFWGLNLYMIANLAYNIALVSVIKYGSAALMYIASTVVLPLGAISFSLGFIMGPHKQSFTAYNLAGLIVVLVGLVFYRFVGGNSKDEDEELQTGHLLIGGANFLERDLPRHSLSKPEPPLNRTNDTVRSVFYGRLGITGSPAATASMPPPPPRTRSDNNNNDGGSSQKGEDQRSRVPPTAQPQQVPAQSSSSKANLASASPKSPGKEFTQLLEPVDSESGEKREMSEKSAEAAWAAGEF